MLRVLLFTAFATCAVAAEWAPPPGEHPRLIFRRQDLPAIRDRLQTPRGRYLFGLVRQSAEHDVLRQGSLVAAVRAEMAAERTAAAAEGRAVERQLHGKCDGTIAYLHNAALVYAVTGEERFGRAAAEALAELIPHASVAALPFAATTYDWAYDQFTEDERTVVRDTFAARSVEVRATMETQPFSLGPSPVNQAIYWGLLQASYMGSAQLAIEGEPGADPELLALSGTAAIAALDRFLDEGGYHENGPAYVGYGFCNFAYFMEALRQRGDDWAAHPRLGRMPEWYCYIIRPGTLGANPMTIPAGNSNFELTTGQDAFIWLYHGMPENPYASIACRHAMAPAYVNLYPRTVSAQFFWDRPYLPDEAAALARLPRCKWFPDGGLFVRSGWDRDALVFWLKTQQYLCNTGKHEDYGTFLLEAWGEVFATEGAGKVVASEVHNLVFIDGRAMDRGSYLMPSQPLVELLASPVAAIGVTDLAEAYGVDSHYTADNAGIDPRPLNPVDHYRRLGGIVWGSHGAADYAVIGDDVDKDGQDHEYRWQMLVPADVAVAEPPLPGGLTLGRPKQPTDLKVNPPVLDCFNLGPDAPLSLDVQETEAGTRKRLLATTTAVNPRFTLLLSPRVPGAPAFFAMMPPGYQRLDAAGGHGAVLDWHGECRDRILVSYGDVVDAAGIRTDARLLVARDDTAGHLLALTVVDATHVTVDGIQILSTAMPVSFGLDVATGALGVGVAATERVALSGVPVRRASRYSGVVGGLELPLEQGADEVVVRLPAPFFDPAGRTIDGGPRPLRLDAP